MLVVLLGYFKAKPVVFNPGFHQINPDLKYVYQTILPGPGCRPFNLTPKENGRISNVFFSYGTSALVWSPMPSIIYFNSRILSQLLTSFEYHRDTKKIGIVKQASPVAWHNINLKETYNFELSERLPDLEELMCSIEGYLPISAK